MLLPPSSRSIAFAVPFLRSPPSSNPLKSLHTSCRTSSRSLKSLKSLKSSRASPKSLKSSRTSPKSLKSSRTSPVFGVCRYSSGATLGCSHTLASASGLLSQGRHDVAETKSSESNEYGRVGAQGVVDCRFRR